MKRISFKYLLAMTALAMMLSACKPEKLVLDPAPSKLEGINGTFTLVQVVQVDENAAPGTTDELNVSTAFIGTDAPSITFNSSAKTFTYNTGTSPDYLGASGTWAFDDDDYPSKVVMNNGTQYDLNLLHTIRPQDEFLEVELTRSCGGAATLRYQYKFQRN
jgi:Domain of unknown function (DUF5004)